MSELYIQPEAFAAARRVRACRERVIEAKMALEVAEAELADATEAFRPLRIEAQRAFLDALGAEPPPAAATTLPPTEIG